MVAFWPAPKTMVARTICDEILAGVANVSIAEKIARGVNDHQGWKMPGGGRARLTSSELADAIALAHQWAGHDNGKVA